MATLEDNDATLWLKDKKVYTQFLCCVPGHWSPRLPGLVPIPQLKANHHQPAGSNRTAKINESEILPGLHAF